MAGKYFSHVEHITSSLSTVPMFASKGLPFEALCEGRLLDGSKRARSRPGLFPAIFHLSRYLFNC